jgi:ABC-type lipoprotein release transport system permease subunit
MLCARDLVRDLDHAARRLLRSPLDPLTQFLAALALVGAAGLAAWLPARHAAIVEPAAVLRQE